MKDGGRAAPLGRAALDFGPGERSALARIERELLRSEDHRRTTYALFREFGIPEADARPDVLRRSE
jgi:hypothetical protein